MNKEALRNLAELVYSISKSKCVVQEVVQWASSLEDGRVEKMILFITKQSESVICTDSFRDGKDSVL